MGRRMRWIMYGAICLVIVLAVVICLHFYRKSENPFDSSGWVGQQYVNANGETVTGWYTIEGKRYYFDLVTGDKTVGWMEKNQKRYYFDESGAMVTGWYTNEDGTYLFQENGNVCIGWMETDKGRRCFDESGVMKTGLLEQEDGIWHFSDDGEPTVGWYENRYFDDNGKALIGWQELAQGRCYFDESGIAAQGWQEIESKRYYFKDGVMQTGWMELEGERFYLKEDGTMAVGQVTIDGVSRFFTSQGKSIVVVNPWHAVPEDYVLELTKMENREIHVDAAEALEKLLEAVRGAGHQCYINYAYRSYEVQRYLYNSEGGPQLQAGQTPADVAGGEAQSMMPAGYCEHQLGLAVDMQCGNATYEWLAEHCWEYGFILRYPQGKSDKTGMIYDRRHFRYVGVELAMELKESGLCLEEYMEQLTMSTTEEQ